MKTDTSEMEPTALFESFIGSGSRADDRWRHAFYEPLLIYEAHTVSDVARAVAIAERETAAGRWAVLMLAYEAAPAFDPVFKVHTVTDFPLAWVAIFAQPGVAPTASSNDDIDCSSWEMLIDRLRYEEAIRRIRAYIEAGDTYQVNYTFPLQARFHGDALAWFGELGSAQGAGFCAYLNLGQTKILSLSPELFFERRGEQLQTRPMKGTMRRGRWREEDEDLKVALAASEKDRAENLMIVDLLRNDLGRLATVGSVKVTRLFDVETYKTVHQMTSTITATCRADTGLWEILSALFPCGSITGAPKIRTMEIIRELEPAPRRAYTGAIGVIRPGGDCVFNVAIRTIRLDAQTGSATTNVGGGITYDSTPAGEYDECLTKIRYLNERPPEFSLLESLLLEDGEYFLLEHHLRRMRESAGYFDFPFDEAMARAQLAQLQGEHSSGNWKVRLLLGRDGKYAAEIAALAKAMPSAWRVRFAAQPIDEGDVFLYHKTTNRAVYERARQQAGVELGEELGEIEEAILWNAAGEVTEACAANLVWEEAGKLYTPPRQCGLLAGTFREELLATGVIKERVITKERLREAEKVYLINSVRRWMLAALID